MQSILHPVTDFATVKKCLTISMKVTQKLNQEYTLVTTDLAAANIAHDLIWGDKELYEKVIVNLGPFHTMCSYMGVIVKMMSGSGFEDIVVDAGMRASGSFEQVMSGKHYNRSVRVHQRMLDALERMLLMSFNNSVESGQEHDNLSAAVNFALQPTAENRQNAEDSETCKTYLMEYDKFKAAVRYEKFGKTAQFWLQYCDSIWVLLTYQRAVKENNMDLFSNSMRKICGLLFSADHLNYGIFQCTTLSCANYRSHIQVPKC